MISYRFRRRAFLGAVGGGLGLKVMLRNLETSAQTAASPPRFLVTYWPLAIIPGSGDALWKPTMGAAGGYALQPFADNGLGDQMITLRGVSSQGIPLNGGGSREGGTVVLVTATACGGTRANRGESDDAFAAGPSIDQIFLRNVPGLRPPAGGLGYANSICDLRTDLGELSTKCLSYSYDKQAVTLYNGGTDTENVPLMGTLSPLDQYTRLFSSLAPAVTAPRPGASTSVAAAPAVPAPVADAMLTQLASRRSVLDFALAEIARLKAMVPSGARDKLQTHYDAVLGLETHLTKTIESRYPTVTGAGGNGAGVGGAAGMGMGGGGRGASSGTGGSTGLGGDRGEAGTSGAAGIDGNPGAGLCKTRPAAPADIHGMPDWTTGGHGNYGSPKNGSTDDLATHETTGRLHMEVLRAAFVCDLIRCGTFQWAPAISHVGFKGMYPGDPNGIYQHHAVSHAVGNGSPTEGTSPDTIVTPQIRFLYNVEAWYFARHAEILKQWKDTTDGFGNPLLDTTIIPFVTETTDYNDGRTNMPEMIFGGRKLGMQLGQYKTGNFTINSFWGTLAQALGYDSTAPPLAAPIPGLWVKPPG